MERDELERLVLDTGCAERVGSFLCLLDPHWTASQCEVYAHMKERFWDDESPPIDRGWLCIPTGGSSGGLKFARHDEETLAAAVQGFCEHFEIEQVDVLDVLPPWHVSGLMARVRCLGSGGRHCAWEWKQLESGVWPETTGNEVLSLVPTQLQRLLTSPRAVERLRGLKLILLGGGPGWGDLRLAAREAGLPVAFSYGMTETAAMVTAQRPPEFANGDASSGGVLPHARVTIIDEQTGMAVRSEEMGIVQIEGESVMRGYWGEGDIGRVFVTADRGWLDSAGYLHIAGRRDDVVITGGEKINSRMVEQVLRETGLFTDVAVIGLPHNEWGEELVACYTGEVEAGFDQVINSHLVRHQRPKRYFAISKSDWPRNAQGKVNRSELLRLAVERD